MGETVQWLETKEGAVVDRWRLDKKGCKKGLGSAKRRSNRTQSFIPRGQTGPGGCNEDAPVDWQRYDHWFCWLSVSESVIFKAMPNYPIQSVIISFRQLRRTVSSLRYTVKTKGPPKVPSLAKKQDFGVRNSDRQKRLKCGGWSESDFCAAQPATSLIRSNLILADLIWYWLPGAGTKLIFKVGYTHFLF